MTSIKLRTCRLPVVTILVIPAALGCSLQGETPPDQIQIVTDAVETASQFNANQVLIVGNLGFNVKDAVGNVIQERILDPPLVLR